MILEVFNAEGDRVEWTEHPDNPICMPSKAAFQIKQGNGLKFKLDGKVIKTYDKLLEAIKSKANP